MILLFNLKRFLTSLTLRKIKGGNMPYGEYGNYRWETTNRRRSEMNSNRYDYDVIIINRRDGMFDLKTIYEVSSVEQLDAILRIIISRNK